MFDSKKFKKLGIISKCSLIQVMNAVINIGAQDHCAEIGFNSKTGCVYAKLENGISILSSLGQEVDFIVYNQEIPNKYESFKTYRAALHQMQIDYKNIEERK